MLDNQELVICSDMITYVSLAQGQALQSETDRSKQKDLITVYRNQKEEHYTTYHWSSIFIKFSSSLHLKCKARTTSPLTITVF
jgi:hypothetical protein